jgi:hypothetical protein
MPDIQGGGLFHLEFICDRLHVSRWPLGLVARAAMTEKPYRFSQSAIEELNRHPDDSKPLPTRLFALLILGLTALLLLFYLLIVTPQ